MRDRLGLAGIATLALLAGCAKPPPPEPLAAPAKPHRAAPQKVAALLNQPGAAIEAALGPPVLRHPESGGEVWLYAHASGCSVDIQLFPTKGELRVAHATTRTPPSMTEAACLQAIADTQ